MTVFQDEVGILDRLWSEREQEVLRLGTGLEVDHPHNAREIGLAIGVPTSTARGIEARALKKLFGSRPTPTEAVSGPRS